MILYDQIFIGVLLGGSLLMYMVTEVAVKYINTEWRALYCLPPIVGLFFLTIAGFEPMMLGAYAGMVLLLGGFLKDNIKVRRIVCVGAMLLGLITIPVCLCNKGYRADDYVKDFKDGVKSMKEHYILAEHKGVDLDALYEAYLPMFEEANKEHDPVANVIAWCLFSAEFHDGHIGFTPKEEETWDEALRRAAGNDYGLSLVTLADGRVVAVNVEESELFQSAGIENGTIITSWDGREIADAAEDSVLFRMTPYADKDNQDFERAWYAAGVGGESVTITYLDSNGAEQDLVIPKAGEYFDRLEETKEIINQGVETGHMMWAEVSDEAVALRVKMMMFDTESSKSSDFENMKKEIRENAAEYQAAGKTHLIIDLRNNGGGSGQMVKAIASLFAPEGEYYYCTDGLWDDETGGFAKDTEGNYRTGTEHYFQGENIWNGPITLLVNQNSASASDHLTKVMQGMENVTVMGFTEPHGSAQGLGAVKLRSGQLNMSGSLILDKDGEIFIDSGTDFESNNQVDVVIPFDEEAVKVLFEEGGDYVLKECLEYQKSKE